MGKMSFSRGSVTIPYLVHPSWGHLEKAWTLDRGTWGMVVTPIVQSLGWEVLHGSEHSKPQLSQWNAENQLWWISIEATPNFPSSRRDRGWVYVDKVSKFSLIISHKHDVYILYTCVCRQTQACRCSQIQVDTEIHVLGGWLFQVHVGFHCCLSDTFVL